MSDRRVMRAGAAAVPISAVVLLFVVSGAAGLIYEVIWLRTLTLVFGKTVHAASAVLAAFMAGLALGSAGGGRVADRLPASPLRLYALLEAGIGVWALLLPLVQEGLAALYVAMSGPFEQLPATLSLTRFVLATIALMPATVMMGATLPALARWAVRHEREVGSRLGLLYALNTLGGVIGCLAAGFFLLEWLGLTGATVAAAFGNFAVAGIALSLSRREPTREQTREEAHEATRVGTPGVRPQPAPGIPVTPRHLAVVASVFLGGFGALVLEVVWTRTLLLVFGSTSYSFSAMLAVFLFGIGAGSLLMTPFADRLRRPWIALGVMQGAIGLLVLLSAHAIDRLPEIYLRLLAWRGITWSNELQAKFLFSAVLMLLPTVLSGAVWPVAVRLFAPRRATLGEQVGRLYAANTAGSILGALAGAFVFLPALGMQYSLVAISLVFAAVGAALVLLEPAPLARRAAVSIGLAALAATLGLTLAPWDKKLLTSGAYFMPRAYLDDAGNPVLRDRLRETRLLYYAEGVTTTPSVAILGDINKAFFNDGKIEGATALDGLRLQRTLGHLPFLMHTGEPATALNIGLGSGITVGAMGVHPHRRIDCAEIEPVVLGAARQFDRETFSVLDRPGLRMIYNDGRNHLMLTQERYDVMSSMPFAPLVGDAASLYSLEHFRLVRDHLAPGGMVTQYLPLYQLAPRDFLSIMKTFAEVFPEATVWLTGVETVLLGTDAPLSVDFGRLAARMRDGQVAESLRQIGLDDPMRLLATYTFRVSDVAADLEGIPLNTDDRPRIEFTAPRSHLVNTVRDNLAWLLARRRTPAPYIRFPPEWPAGDDRPRQLLGRLETALRAQELTVRGRMQILAGDLEGGIATLEQAAQTDPADIYARDLASRNLVKLAEQRYAAGREDDAVRAYERSLHWDPIHFLALYNLARFAWERGDAEGARRMTVQALEQAPHSPSLHYRMGLLLQRDGDTGQAERHLEEAMELDPEYADPLLVLGDIHRAREDHPRATFLYRQAIERGRRDAESYSALAQSLADEGKHAESAEYVGKALALSPSHAEAFYTRARLRLAEGKRDEAARDLGAAVQNGGDRYRKRAMADPGLKQLLN